MRALLAAILLLGLLAAPQRGWSQGSPIIQGPITPGHCTTWSTAIKVGDSGSACSMGGTVTSIATGTGLLGGPITGSGTISLDTTRVFTSGLNGLTPASAGGIINYLRADGTWRSVVTAVTSGAGLMGGTISTTGTIAIDPTFLFTSVTSGLAPASAGGTTNFLRADGSWAAPPVVSAANPTATAGPAAVNGTATTFMRSDGAPAVQKGSASAFGIVEADGSTITASAGVLSAPVQACMLLATSTPSGVNTVAFTSIGAGYAHLRVVGAGRSVGAGTGTDIVGMQFNADSAANYAWQTLVTSGAGAPTASQSTGQTSGQVGEMPTAGDLASIQGTILVDIPLYSGTTFAKAWRGEYQTITDATAAGLAIADDGGLWTGTAAITRIDLTETANFVAGTTFSLYGCI